MSGPEGTALAFFVLGGGFWVVRPLAAAIAKRIAGEHRLAAPDPQEREAVAEELQQLRQEMTELQERMDFAERLLAKQRGADRLAPPH
jgi:ubiquinone biosynthesis protein UbiJ